MSDEAVNNELSDAEMDAALAPPERVPAGIQDKAPEQPQTVQEYNLKVNGKEIKAPIDKVLQWAQMGYDYPQKAAQLKAQEAEWQQKLQEKEKHWNDLEQKWKPYKEVDEYAAKNPDWWNQVQEQYKQVAQQSQNPAVPPEIIEKLSTYDQYIQEQKAKEAQAQVQKEDEALANDIKSIRTTYPNIDWDTPEEGTGLTLEMKVLDHAVKNDLKSFKVAFRDYYHDHLVGKAKEEGKELVSKELAKRSKLGILGESTKPTKGLTTAANVRGKSYNDLMDEAKAELGII